MIVTRGNFREVMDALFLESHLSADVETTGLFPHKGDVMFSLMIGSKVDTYYFNFNIAEDIPEECELDQPVYWDALKRLFLDPFKTWYAHNAKFDLGFLRKEGVEVAGKIHDTKTHARLLWNDHMLYSLKDCVKRDIGMEKSDTVENYIKEHKLYEDIQDAHGNKKDRKVHFHRVPFDIITEYGLQDARITFTLGEHQRQLLSQEPPSKRHPPLGQVSELEKRLVRPVLDMQWYGIRIDRSYCERSVRAEEDRAIRAASEFSKLTGREFLDSNKLFSEVFDPTHVPRTLKGNPSFDKNSLEKMGDSPIARTILDYRDAKRQSDYFNSFLYYSDSAGVIHPDFLADGTSSGRFSSRSPNLQNLSKPEESGEDDSGGGRPEVRAAFVPREGTRFFILDFRAQEHRLLVDLSGAKEIARQVSSGADVHAETAKKAGVTRHEAKVTLFSCIAEGEKVLTSNGLKPIETVTREDLVWDGVEFVSHEGVVYQGLKEVIDYAGLRATKCHEVFTESHGKISLEEAKQRKLQVLTTEFEGTPRRVPDSYDKRILQRQRRSSEIFSGESALLGVFKSIRYLFVQHHGIKNTDMSMSNWPQVWAWSLRSCTNVAKKISRYGSALQQSAFAELQKLWGPWNTAQDEQMGISGVEPIAVLPSGVKVTDCGSYRQQWALRNRESSSYKTVRSDAEYESDTTFCRVYDILNAGPRHRFTVSGKLVSNCLYGAGVNKIAETLKCSPAKARDIKDSILNSAPEIKKFLYNTIEEAEIYKKVHSWYGRVFRFPNRSDCYRAPNYVIQGGCADITKIAIVRCYEHISRYKSRMILTVHDSIVFEIVDGEEFLVEELAQIMREAYPYRILPMDVSVEVGEKNMAETEKYEILER